MATLLQVTKWEKEARQVNNVKSGADQKLRTCFSALVIGILAIMIFSRVYSKSIPLVLMVSIHVSNE